MQQVTHQRKLMGTESPIILHKGVFKNPATTAEAVFVITGMTIGAGILGIPYAVSRVGLRMGLLYIAVLGLVILLLNLMLGEVAAKTDQPLQIPGLAGKYLGAWARRALSFITIISAYGALIAYIAGEGKVLSALFGGSPLSWSVLFWSVASIVVWRGLQMAKGIEKLLSLTVIAVIAIVSLALLPKFQPVTWIFFDRTNLLLPFGIILFALHASPAIIEAHALLPGNRRAFRKALIIGTLIPIVVYMLFTLAVVGSSGLLTTEVATIGLGTLFGERFLLAGNLFAVLSMGTGFIGLGIALKQTLVWDSKISPRLAEVATIAIPILLFALGVRNFVRILDVVGGLFIGVEALIIVLLCWRAQRVINNSGSLKKFWLAASPVLVVFSVITILNVVSLIKRIFLL